MSYAIAAHTDRGDGVCADCGTLEPRSLLRRFFYRGRHRWHMSPDMLNGMGEFGP